MYIKSITRIHNTRQNWNFYNSNLKVSFAPRPSSIALGTASRIRLRGKYRKKKRPAQGISVTGTKSLRSDTEGPMSMSSGIATAERMLMAREWLALARILDRCFLLLFLLATFLLTSSLFLYGVYRMYYCDHTKGDAESPKNWLDNNFRTLYDILSSVIFMYYFIWLFHLLHLFRCKLL